MMPVLSLYKMQSSWMPSLACATYCVIWFGRVAYISWFLLLLIIVWMAACITPMTCPLHTKTWSDFVGYAWFQVWHCCEHVDSSCLLSFINAMWCYGMPMWLPCYFNSVIGASKLTIVILKASWICDLGWDYSHMTVRYHCLVALLLDFDLWQCICKEWLFTMQFEST